MAEKKLKKLSKKKASATKTGTSKSAKSIMESANQIWLAGLGAFAKAQEEGGKIFENLVKEGQELEAKTRKVTTSRAKDVRDVMEDTVSQVQSRATESWDKLEKVFEERVAKALGALGVPTAKDVQALTRRVEELQKAVDAYNRKAEGATPAAPGKTARKTAARAGTKKKATTGSKKTSRKKTASKKTASKKTASKETASTETTGQS